MADIRDLSMLSSGCATTILAVHVIEHFARWEVPDILREWARLLKSEGTLILELPDLAKCARNFLVRPDDEQQGLWGIYGDAGKRNELMLHKWGWTPLTMRRELLSVGFKQAREVPTQFHKAGRRHRDMRLEALKF